MDINLMQNFGIRQEINLSCIRILSFAKKNTHKFKNTLNSV